MPSVFNRQDESQVCNHVDSCRAAQTKPVTKGNHSVLLSVLTLHKFETVFYGILSPCDSSQCIFFKQMNFWLHFFFLRHLSPVPTLLWNPGCLAIISVCSNRWPCEFPSLDSCQKTFLWAHKEAYIAVPRQDG